MAKIIAHRGFAKIKKENTIAAFEYAAKSNAYGIETDIQVTLDNNFVTFHDGTTKRLCGRYKILAESDLKTIQKIKVRYKTIKLRIPTLSEYLALCKSGNKKAVIEIKCNLTDKQLQLFVNLIETEFSVGDSIFISFDSEILKKIRAYFPNVQCQYIRRAFEDSDFETCVNNKFDLDIYYKNVDSELVKKCHSAGIKINCWTVNNKKAFAYLKKIGVDYITSDKDWNKNNDKKISFKDSGRSRKILN